MGCGCLLALASMLSPRLAIILVWIFSDRMAIAFSSFWIAFIGFLVLPWTTLAWAVAYAPRGGVTGFGWFIVILAFLADLSTLAGGAEARRRRRAEPAY